MYRIYEIGHHSISPLQIKPRGRARSWQMHAPFCLQESSHLQRKEGKHTGCALPGMDLGYL